MNIWEAFVVVLLHILFIGAVFGCLVAIPFGISYLFPGWTGMAGLIAYFIIFTTLAVWVLDNR